jgi:hypothetical protein
MEEENNNKHIILGALESHTKKYVLPNNASRHISYICIECNENLIFKKGNIKRPHFSHKAKSECTYYEHPSESQIHKDAKYRLADWVTNKKDINFHWKCLNTELYGKYCNKEDDKTKYKITYEEGDIVKVEYRNENPLFIADVAIINENKIKYVFEIHHTNKTLTETRPEPWFEVNAKDIINSDESNINLYNIRSNNYSYCKFCSSDKVDCDGMGMCNWIDQNEPYEKSKNCNCIVYKCSVPRCKERLLLWMRYRWNGYCWHHMHEYDGTGIHQLKISNEQYISEHKMIYKNKFDFSNTLYIDDNTLIKVKCNICNNIFEHSPKKYIECLQCKKEQEKTIRKQQREYNKYVDIYNKNYTKTLCYGRGHCYRRDGINIQNLYFNKVDCKYNCELIKCKNNECDKKLPQYYLDELRYFCAKCMIIDNKKLKELQNS